jgi:hypothetical protein
MEIRRGCELLLFGESGCVSGGEVLWISLMVMLIGGRRIGVVPSRTMMSDVDRACSMASPSVIVLAHTAQIPKSLMAAMRGGSRGWGYSVDGE